MNKYKLHIRKSTDNQWYYTLNGRNGKVMLTSETFKRARSAIKQADKLAVVLDASVVHHDLGLPMLTREYKPRPVITKKL